MSFRSKVKKIAVIVAAKGHCRDLVKCIKSLLVQNYPTYEIIVVDDGIEESTLAMIKNNESVRIIVNQKQGASSARNSGVKKTDADYVAFIDSDCIAEKDWKAVLIVYHAVACREFPRMLGHLNIRFLPL